MPIPFEDEIPQMTKKNLETFVYNWLWEIPLEFTPNKEDVLRLIDLIQKRADAGNCQELVRSCWEYVSVFDSQDPDIIRA